MEGQRTIPHFRPILLAWSLGAWILMVGAVLAGTDVAWSTIYGVSIQGVTLAREWNNYSWIARVWESASSPIVTIGYRWWSVGQYCHGWGWSFYRTFPGSVDHYDDRHYNHFGPKPWVGCNTALSVMSQARHEFGHCNPLGECDTKFLHTIAWDEH